MDQFLNHAQSGENCVIFFCFSHEVIDVTDKWGQVTFLDYKLFSYICSKRTFERNHGFVLYLSS